MPTIRTLLSAALVLSTAFVGRATGAEEPSLKFLHALQQNGYGDMAVDYLKTMAQQPNLPQNIRDVWDLEMAKSLRAAADDAFDAKEHEQLMAQSQEHLAEFLKEKPNHPEALAAMALWGDIPVKQALQLIRKAESLGDKDPQKQAGLLDEARRVLEESRQRFQQASETFAARVAQSPLPKRKKAGRDPADARQEAESNLSETLFQTALIDYYLAQTYLDPRSKEHTDNLRKAAKEFDDIYQANRANTLGVYAHMWHGKATEELGDFQTALDIYDEVLVNAPAPESGDKGATTDLDPLFTQVEHFRLLIFAKQNPKQFFTEAKDWLKLNQRLKHTDGYQSIALELAKAQFDAAVKANGSERTKRLGEALQFTSDLARMRSQYQSDFILLRRELLKASGREKTEATTVDEAMTLADAAAAGQQWDLALSSYNTALQLAEKPGARDESRLKTIREAMANVQLAVARELFNKGQFNESLEMVKNILRDDKDSTLAAQASAVAVTAVLNLYATAPDNDKAKLLEQLNRVAEFTENHWPDRPEADDARMARARAKLVIGQVTEAIEVFERVNPKSERYAMAAYLAGENYWRRYLSERDKPDGARNKEQMAADRAKAIARLSTSLETFRGHVGFDRSAQKCTLAAQLLLAEIRAEGNEMKEAAALYQPLVDVVKTEKPQTFDDTIVRIFLGAIRTYQAIDDLDQAVQVGTLLTELAPDAPQANSVLVEFARLLNVERKKADARLTELGDAANLADLQAAKKKLDSTEKLLGTVLAKLAGRQDVSLPGMVFVGEALTAIGHAAEASQLYQNILKRAETDEEFAHTWAKALTRVRAQLLGVLRQDGQYAEALRQADRLIEENPRALDFLMEKGRILDDWAQRDPSHYDEAVTHWCELRNRLQQVRGKKPEEYYEVMYRVADCLVRDAQKSNDKKEAGERAKQAEQVLKSALILSPSLNGPDAVARYKALLNKAILLQGRQPAPEAPAAQAKKSE